MSNSHLVKQLAPFNKSPDLDRHRNRDDMDEDLDSLSDKGLNEEPGVEEVVVSQEMESFASTLSSEPLCFV